VRWEAASKQLRRLDAGNEASLYAMPFIEAEHSNGFVNDAFLKHAPLGPSMPNDLLCFDRLS
jgi:hypothetical protein